MISSEIKNEKENRDGILMTDAASAYFVFLFSEQSSEKSAAGLRAVDNGCAEFGKLRILTVLSFDSLRDLGGCTSAEFGDYGRDYLTHTRAFVGEGFPHFGVGRRSEVYYAARADYHAGGTDGFVLAFLFRYYGAVYDRVFAVKVGRGILSGCKIIQDKFGKYRSFGALFRVGKVTPCVIRNGGTELFVIREG